ncbi:MAG: hypothetical protein IPO63_14205 [Bacteroidetes bacterium]|nr:hypothetical protein [Bacteroidota bacterium]
MMKILVGGSSCENVGTQLKTSEGAEREKLPFEIQVGVSRKLPKLLFDFLYSSAIAKI